MQWNSQKSMELKSKIAQNPELMQQLAAKFLMTMKEYPPSQTAGSFNLDKVQKQIEASISGK